MTTTNCSCFPIVQKPKKMPLKIKVGGMQRSNKVPQMKKVAPPVVPEMANRNSTGNYVTMDSRITTYDENFSPQPSPLRAPHTPTRENFEHGYFSANGVCQNSSPVCNNYQQFTFSATQQHYNTVLAASPRSTSTNNSLPSSPLPIEAISNYSQGHHHFFDKYVHLSAPVASNGNLDDQGIDVQTPSQESPGSSGSSASGVATSTSGCRNSTTSLDSGRASASNYDAKSGQSSFAPSSSSSSSSSSGSSSASSSQHRLSGQSYESSTSLRHSYHSSSSSLGSMDRLDERGPHSNTGSYHVGKLLADGVPDSEVLRYWLTDLHFEDYYQLFVQAGYDLPTISRMTPEDLTAIGITKPAHRKKLKAEIVKMNISDGLPEYVPGSLDEWLRLLRLEEYAECLAQQGYNSVEDVLGIAWEDLEEIGIRKLGHQKKVMLALKRVRDIQSGVRRFSSAENWTSVEVNVALPSHRTLHHQHSISQGHPGYHSPAYHGPEVMTIGGTMGRPHPSSPMTNSTPASEEMNSVPQFSTFHHPTMPHQHRQQGLSLQAGGGGYSVHFAPSTGSPMHLVYNPDILTVMQGRHPSGARSLENLDHESENATVVPIRHHVSFQAPPVSSSYESHRRRSSFDDGDVTPTNEMVGTGVGVAVGNGGLYLLQDGVGGTLPRPKVSVKPRPVAKIVAKTRRLSSDRDDDQDQSDLVKNQKDAKGCKVECTAVIHGLSGTGSGSLSLPGSPRNSLLRASASKRTPPPPPPKRTNSVRLSHNPHQQQQQQEKEKMSNEQLFATCVKTLASKFGMTRQSAAEKRPGAKDATVTSDNVESTESTTSAHISLEHLDLDVDQSGDTLSQPDSDSPSQNSVPDFGEFADQADRSPPSPAPGSPVRCLSDTRPSTSCSSPSPSPSSSNSPSPSPSMCLAQPKRNESTSSLNSNVSTSSTESNSLPFANENAGTIKQRAVKPHPPLPGIPSSEREGSMSPRTALSTLSSTQAASKRQSASKTPPQTADPNLRQNRPHDTGDVLNDIDNMLANLTDELDAMLTSELENQP